MDHLDHAVEAFDAAASPNYMNLPMMAAQLDLHALAAATIAVATELRGIHLLLVAQDEPDRRR